MDRDQLRAMPGEVKRLRETFSERPVSEVKETLYQLEALRRSVHASLIEAVADIDARQGWKADGCASMTDWLSFRLGYTRKSAHEVLDAARALGDLPHLSATYAEGELSWDKTRAVASLATPDSDEALTTEAMNTDAGRLEAAARRARAVSREEAERRHCRRFFALRRSAVLGGVKMSGFLPDVDGETLIKAIERLADDVPKDSDTGLYPSFDERCADALVDLASAHLADEQPNHGEPAMVVAHVDMTPAGSAGTQGGARYEFESGITIAPETMERLLCDAVVEPVFEVEGRTIGVGDKTRRPPGWLRRQLMDRDVGCRFPGCSRIRLTHAHHLVPVTEKLITDRNNLALLCRYHHRKMHEGGWTMRGDPDDVVDFVKPNGEVLTSELPMLSDDVKQRILGPLLL